MAKRTKTELTMRHLDAYKKDFRRIEQDHVLMMGNINKINRRLDALEGAEAKLEMAINGLRKEADIINKFARNTAMELGRGSHTRR